MVLPVTLRMMSSSSVIWMLWTSTNGGELISPAPTSSRALLSCVWTHVGHGRINDLNVVSSEPSESLHLRSIGSVLVCMHEGNRQCEQWEMVSLSSEGPLTVTRPATRADGQLVTMRSRSRRFDPRG